VSADNKRNGQDREPIVVPVPVEAARTTPVDVRKVPPGIYRDSTEMQQRIYDGMLQLLPAVNSHSDQLADNTTQVILLTKAFNSLGERNAGFARAFDELRESLTRDKQPSLHDIAEALQGAVADGFEDAVERTNPGIDPEKPRTISERVRAESKLLTIQEKADKWDNQAKDRRKILTGIYIAVGAAVILGILGVAVSLWKITMAHDQGVNEGRAAAPVMVVPVPSPASSVEPAVLFPAVTAMPPSSVPRGGPAPPHHP
jgi:hypothetical protein